MLCKLQTSPLPLFSHFLWFTSYPMQSLKHVCVCVCVVLLARCLRIILFCSHRKECNTSLEPNRIKIKKEVLEWPN